MTARTTECSSWFPSCIVYSGAWCSSVPPRFEQPGEAPYLRVHSFDPFQHGLHGLSVLPLGEFPAASCLSHSTVRAGYARPHSVWNVAVRGPARKLGAAVGAPYRYDWRASPSFFLASARASRRRPSRRAIVCSVSSYQERISPFALRIRYSSPVWLRLCPMPSSRLCRSPPIQSICSAISASRVSGAGGERLIGRTPGLRDRRSV